MTKFKRKPLYVSNLDVKLIKQIKAEAKKRQLPTWVITEEVIKKGLSGNTGK